MKKLNIAKQWTVEDLDREIGKNRPISGKSKQSAKNFIYNKMGDRFSHIFSDQYWNAVQDFWIFLQDLGVMVSIDKAEYHENENGVPDRKTWFFTLTWAGKDSKLIDMSGSLVASGAGSVKNPLDKYDVAVVLF